MKIDVNEKNVGRIVDLHCHILPGMDDGAKTPEMSRRLLSMATEQGIDTVVATPHFYPENEAPESFLSRRRAAVELLCEHIGGEALGLPRIYLGAECAYYAGIGASPEPERLCILGTRVLLLEMPFERWSESVFRDVFMLCERGIQVVIAHIERYIGFQKRNALGRLIAGGALIQANAEYFLEKRSVKRALRLLRDGGIQLLGSDCHNTESRAQNLGSAVDVILATRYGAAVLADIGSLSAMLLKNAEAVALGEPVAQIK